MVAQHIHALVVFFCFALFGSGFWHVERVLCCVFFFFFCCDIIIIHGRAVYDWSSFLSHVPCMHTLGSK